MAEMKLNPAEWREELRARHQFALRIAYDCVNAYGPLHEKTIRAFRAADALGVVVTQEGA